MTNFSKRETIIPFPTPPSPPPPPPPPFSHTKFRHCGLVLCIKINIVLGVGRGGDYTDNSWEKRLSVPTLLTNIVAMVFECLKKCSLFSLIALFFSCIYRKRRLKVYLKRRCRCASSLSKQPVHLSLKER